MDLWNIKDKNGHALRRGDYILLNGELVKLTYLTAFKMIIRTENGMQQLKPNAYKGRIANVEWVHSPLRKAV